MLMSFRDRNFWIVFSVDAFLLGAAYSMAYLLRYDGGIPAQAYRLYEFSIFGVMAGKLAIYYMMGLYRGMWRYTSITDAVSIVKANGMALLVTGYAVYLVTDFQGVSRGVFIIDAILSTGFICAFRLMIRLLTLGGTWQNGFLQAARGKFAAVKRVLIVGAGDTGEKLLREIMQNRDLAMDVAGFVDDNPFKQRHMIHGIKVMGNREDIPRLVKEEEIDEIIIAIPSATAQQMRQVVAYCRETGKPFKTVPGLPELIQGRVSVSAIRDVSYDDLLGRDAVCMEKDEVCGYLSGKRVMVTGAAGSIGSELCRQIAAQGPAHLYLVDRNESGLYELHLDLKARFPDLAMTEVLAAIQNRSRMDHIFKTSRPEVVFHAAAYKHVPMMELHPWEAVFNNIVGSFVLLDMCLLYHVDRCVLISTDKAVRPTNVMGASKRLVERMVQCYARVNGVRYMAVRFGNVLGSAGSVLPLFKKQIARGGPVTVTHPEVTRYFMTIPEAVSLVLQAGGLGRGGEIFILKMGTPVKIADMARDLISLSGFVPDKEIKIEYRGLRPGEKLYEELISEGEGIVPTRLKGIMVLNCPEILSMEEMAGHIRRLVELAKAGDGAGIRGELQAVVPEYAPEDGKQRTEGGGRKAEDGRRRTEDGGRRAEGERVLGGEISVGV